MPDHRADALKPDRIQNAGPGEPVDAWIYSSFPKDHWVARKPADFTHAEHPGTALQIGADLFEIVAADSAGEPGYVIRYGLKKWEARHVVRKVIPYTAETQERAAADFLEETGREAFRKWLISLFFLFGYAPDPLQRQWEQQTAVNMKIVSAASAMTNVGVYLFLTELGHRHQWPMNALFAITFLGFESFVRLLWIWFSGAPHGGLLLSAPYIAWEAIARPDKRAERRGGRTDVLEPDEVIRKPGTGHLTIRSMLFDEMLAGTNPIRFDGEIYRPLHWQEEGAGLQRRWVFEFERAEAAPNIKYREYTRPRPPERQKQVEEYTRRRDQAHIWALLWGLYPRNAQLRLEAKYHFPAARWTAVTASFILAAGILQAGIVFVSGWTPMTVAASAYWVLESIYRMYRGKSRGEPAGCLFGYLLNFIKQPPE